MRTFVFLCALSVSGASLAADPQPSWGAGWSANVWNTYCELRRTYNIPSSSDPSQRGYLSGTAFRTAFVRFTTMTRTHGNLITEDQLDILEFALLVYPANHTVPESARILSANLGGFEAEPDIGPVEEIHTFSLDEQESFLLRQKFLNNEVVDFTLRFASGEERQFSIYPSGDRNFHVLEAMFQACIQNNH